MDRQALARDLMDRWGSPVVARRQVYEFSGGLVKPGTLANADSKGEGPSERLKMGRTIGYPVCALALWIAQRVELQNDRAA